MFMLQTATNTTNQGHIDGWQLLRLNKVIDNINTRLNFQMSHVGSYHILVSTNEENFFHYSKVILQIKSAN